MALYQYLFLAGKRTGQISRMNKGEQFLVLDRDVKKKAVNEIRKKK